GFGQAARDGLAHVVELDRLVGRAELGNLRRRGCCGLGRGGAGLRAIEVRLDDAPVRAAALDAGEVYALVRGDALGERGGDDPALRAFRHPGGSRGRLWLRLRLRFLGSGPSFRWD